MDCRAILFHKQATSARLRFLRFAYDSVCAFEPLPPLALVHAGASENPAQHPAPVLRQLAERLGLAAEDLHPEEGYRFVVEVPGERIQVLLVAIQSIDPPFDQADDIGAKFIDLTQARGLPAAELELLRGAYELLLGG